jgi:hypothetical protein
MSPSAAGSVVSQAPVTTGDVHRVAFVGARTWLEGCAPAVAVPGLLPGRFEAVGEGGPSLDLALERFRPDVTVVFDPAALAPGMLAALPRPTLGVLVGDLPEGDGAWARDLDRLVSFKPALSGRQVGSNSVWRAIPPPVSDLFFHPVAALHAAPRVMSIGRSTAHREDMLLPAKHHHDLLQVLHGVDGESLDELLREYDIGVYVAPRPGGGFGFPVGAHLAAGQLLLSEHLIPGHGLERDIDYLQFDSPEGLVWMLDRIGRFPEMHQRVRWRGRLKSEQFRASRLFTRILHDLRLDIAAFGPAAVA